jgi:hypothetical protein
MKPEEEPKQVICRDKIDRVIQNGYYVDVQDSGIHKVYRKEDGQLYFKPYGEEERVSSYFSNDLILISYGSKLIMDLKKEIADKKQEEHKQETLEELAIDFYPDEKWELMERIAFKRGYTECKERMCDESEPKPLDNLEERFKRDMSMVVMPLANKNIPEEEEEEGKMITNWLDKHGDPKIEKQVELQAAAEIHYINCIPSDRHSFIKGAEWQQGQDNKLYSEEEVKFIISEALQSALVKVDLEQWFNQFHKKK